MTREEKELNCSNCRIGDFKQNLCDCHNGFCAKYKGIGTEEDLFKAIEALQADAVQGGDAEMDNCQAQAPQNYMQQSRHNDGTDLISRADAIKAVASITMSIHLSEVICGKLLALPSADAVQGEWIKKQVFNPELDKYIPYIECSVCGYAPYYGGSESKFNYCPNCGARMKGGAE